MRGYGGNPQAVAGVGAARFIAAVAVDGTLRSWDSRTGECEAAFRTRLGEIRQLAPLQLPGFTPPPSLPIAAASTCHTDVFPLPDGPTTTQPALDCANCCW